MAFATNKSLLAKISVGDEIGWEEFYSNYAPLIWIRGGDLLLCKEEKQDLIQDVMLCMFTKAGKFKYDRDKGRFRDYMRTIIDRRADRWSIPFHSGWTVYVCCQPCNDSCRCHGGPDLYC